MLTKGTKRVDIRRVRVQKKRLKEAVDTLRRFKERLKRGSRRGRGRGVFSKKKKDFNKKVKKEEEETGGRAPF